MAEIKVISDLLVDAANDRVRSVRKYVQVNTNQTYNRIDLLSHSKKVSTWLDNSKVGDKVAFLSGSFYEFYAAFYGCEMSGRAAVMLNPAFTMETIVGLLRFTEVTTVFTDCDDDRIKELEAQYPEVSLTIVSLKDSKAYLNIHTLLDETEAKEQDKIIDENSLAAIVFTSGTTGKQKGVMLSHKNIVSDVLSLCKAVDYSYKDKLVSLIPPYHAFGLTCEMLLATYLGVEVVFEENIKAAFAHFSQTEPSIFITVPMMLDMLAKFLTAAEQKMPGADKSVIKKAVLGGNARVIVMGGAASNVDSLKKLFGYGVECRPGYGMSELSPIATYNDWALKYPDSSGELIDIMQYRIKDGEIQFKGSNVCIGYYKDEEEYRKMFDDGWFCTGDLGYVDESIGLLFITGRKKNLIITSSGENVSPELLESKILETGLVREVLVYAQNDRIYAQVFPMEGASEEQIREAIDNVNEKQPTFSQISKVVFRSEEFQKNAFGKIIRTQVLA